MTAPRKTAERYTAREIEFLWPRGETRFVKLSDHQQELADRDALLEEIEKALAAIFVEFFPAHIDRVSGTSVGSDAEAVLTKIRERRVTK